MFATPQVIAALEHVRTFRPEVTQVFYTNELKWLYMTDDGDAPAFGGEIDTSLLEDAVESLDTFPAAFHITSPVRPADAPDNLTLRALVKAELFMSGFEGDEVQEGVDADLASIRQAIQQCQDQAKRGVTVSVSVKGGMITDAAASLPGVRLVVTDFDVEDALATSELQALRDVFAPFPVTDSAFEADDADDRARVEVLLNGVASGMTQRRAVIEQPVSLSYSENIYLEIAPASHDERINVCNHDLGWTTVNYTSEGLILDVFANDQSALSPVSSLQLMRDDLSASDDD